MMTEPTRKERRVYARHQVRLEGVCLIQYSDGRTATTHLIDISPGGVRLLLLETRSAENNLILMQAGDRVRFVDCRLESPEYQLHGTVAEVHWQQDRNVGCQFLMK